MKHLLIGLSLLAGLAGLPPAGAASLRWYGQSCFQVTSASGARVVLDPFGAQVGYPVPSLAADAVLVSHEHFDHNNVGAVKGHPVVLHGLQMDAKPHTVKGVQVRAVRTFHDAQQGKQRGENTVFVLKVDGMTLAHAGDLGAPLSAAQVRAIGPVDVLMVPVGGVYTVDGAGAAQVVRQLRPRLVIPMLYKTPALKIGLDGPEKFADAAKKAGWPVQRSNSSSLTGTRAGLPKKTTVVFLSYR